MFDCALQGLKMCELVLFTNIFVQLVSSLLDLSLFYFWLFLVDSYLLPYSYWFKNDTSLKATSEAYSEPCQTSKMEVFCINEEEKLEEKVFLEISQNSQENTCATESLF